jgi:PAS domain S-box-containing protein
MERNGSNSERANQNTQIELDDRYLRVFDHLPSLMWCSGTDSRRNYFNRSWLAFTRRSLEQELGDGWVEGVHPHDLERCFKTYRSAFDKREPFELEYRLRHHSGEYHWIQDTGQPFYGPSGDFAGYIGTCFDLTEQKQMEKALREANQALETSNAALQKNEEMFKQLFEYAPDAVIAVDQEGKIVLVNRQAESVFGYARDEIIGQPVEMLMPDSFSARHKIHVAGYMSDPHLRPMGKNLSLFGQRKDGSFFPADINLGPLETENSVLVMATIRDVSEHVQAEAAIQEREQLLTTAVQAAPLVFFRIDLEGVIQLSLGQSLARRLNNVDPVGHSIYELYKSVPAVIDSFERALKGETFTTVIETAGQLFETTYAPLINAQGQVQSVLGVASDVTQHRQVEAALLESEAHFRTIFNNAILGIVLVDSDGRLVESNPALQEMLDCSESSLIEMNLLDIIHPEDAPSFQQMLDDINSGRSDYFLAEKRFVSKNNHTLWVRIAMSQFRGQDGIPRYKIGMIENITAKKRIEAELAELQRRLADSAELERLHLAQELHDGPLQDLQAMTMHLSFIESVFESTDNQSELQGLQAEIGKVVRSIRSICGELRPPSLAPFGLQKAIESHAAQFREQYNSLNVHLDLMQDGQALTERVRMALFRIYQQSMANILRHADAKNVWVTFRFDDDAIELTIKDDGKGFTVTKRWIELVRKGHFGLVGSIERAESIGGRLELQSSPGAGTLIRTLVPRREEDQVTDKERFTAHFSLNF